MDTLKSDMINWILTLKDESLASATWEWMTTHIAKDKAVPEKAQTSAVDCLEQLAQMGSFSHIENPVEWQQNIRQDRKLPFR